MENEGAPQPNLDHRRRRRDEFCRPLHAEALLLQSNTQAHTSHDNGWYRNSSHSLRVLRAETQPRKILCARRTPHPDRLTLPGKRVPSAIEVLSKRSTLDDMQRARLGLRRDCEMLESEGAESVFLELRRIEE